MVQALFMSSAVSNADAKSYVDINVTYSIVEINEKYYLNLCISMRMRKL
jgi:hypothetical protein